VPDLVPVAGRICVNGHTLSPGDLLCSICGGDARGSEEDGFTGETTEPQEPRDIDQVTIIGGWEVVVV
jgi:hypothetical protein